MEQRRFLGKSQWYHETQSSQNVNAVQSLVTEAATVNDRFLLDLNVSEQSLATNTSWLAVARDLAKILLPDQVETHRIQTFSYYERLSTALTVAQVFGVQRLCHHYAARLAPESSSDSSRETNRRLTLITQFSRQLASHPTSISNTSLIQLEECGLSSEDIVTFTQLIGFIGFQAQTVALLQAFEHMPVRRIPGLTGQQDADVALFHRPIVRWHANLPPIERRCTTPAQAHALEQGLSSPQLNHLAEWLAFDACTLQRLAQLSHQLRSMTKGLSDDDLLAVMLVSRINGSPYCFNDAATLWQGDPKLLDAILSGEHAVQAWSQNHPRENAIIRAVGTLTRAPNQFSDTQLTPLFEQGFSTAQAFALLVSAGFIGWLNRLSIGLGDTQAELKTLPV